MTHSFFATQKSVHCAQGCACRGQATSRLDAAKNAACRSNATEEPPRLWLVSSLANRTRLGCVSTGYGSSRTSPNGPQRRRLAHTIEIVAARRRYGSLTLAASFVAHVLRRRGTREAISSQSAA